MSWRFCILQRVRFFTKQVKRCVEKEYWAFDTSYISRYTQILYQVKNGKNKEGDRLPKINITLLFGEQSGQPFYYRNLSGNISDVKTLKQLMPEFDVMGFKNVKVILDCGFYSRENVKELFRNHHRFLMGIQAVMHSCFPESGRFYTGIMQSTPILFRKSTSFSSSRIRRLSHSVSLGGSMPGACMKASMGFVRYCLRHLMMVFSWTLYSLATLNVERPLLTTRLIAAIFSSWVNSLS